MIICHQLFKSYFKLKLNNSLEFSKFINLGQKACHFGIGCLFFKCCLVLFNQKFIYQKTADVKIYFLFLKELADDFKD